MTNRTRQSADRRTRPARARGFTLIELLVVVAVIGILIGLVVVGARGVSRAASTTRTTSMLATINQAIAQFKGDLGFEPPIISRMVPSAANAATPAGGIQTPEIEAAISGNNADALNAYRRVRFNSQFSLPVYLMGMGSVSGRPATKGSTSFPPNTRAVQESNAGYRSAALDDGVPGPGIRNPGPLRAWKKPGTNPGTFVHSPDLSGRSYGPYLSPDQMSDLIQLVQVVPDEMRPAINAANGGPNVDATSSVWMYRFIEPSGEPIRYYRQWPTRDPLSTPPNEPSIARVPVELRDGDAIRAELKGTNGAGKPLASDSLVMSAPYMLLAPNADKLSNNLGASSSSPFETDLDALFEACMPFRGVSDPRFNVGTLNSDDSLVKRLQEFNAKAVRLGPQ